MSTMFLAFFTKLVFLSNIFTIQVHGASLPQPINVTKNPVHQPNGREARLLGKLSVVAGVGLPDLGDSSASIANREIVVESDDQQPVIASYNFPPLRWGPYYAAVYEPSLSLFFKDPLKYLASLFNPSRWLGFFGKGSTTTTTKTTTIVATTESPSTFADHLHQTQDGKLVVVTEFDNEIQDEDRKIAANKVHDGIRSGKKKSGSKLVTKVFTTENVNDIDREADLVAEETSENEESHEEEEDEDEDNELTDDSRQSATTQSQKPPPKRTTTRRPGGMTRTTRRRSTKRKTTTPAAPYPTYGPPAFYPSYGPPSYGPPTSWYPTTTTTLRPLPPLSPPAYYPPPSAGGYYYHGGWPQNVSQVELTTPDAGQQFFDNSEPDTQRLPLADNFDSFGFHQRDHNFGELFPPQRRDYREFEPKLGQKGPLFNDFKPSYPYLVGP